MIYTVTLNPSIDYVMEVENFTQGEVNRDQKDHKFPGGKGINVSRVLNQLEIDSKLLGFVGGFTGKFIEAKLKEEELALDFTEIIDDSRINVKLRSTDETEINGHGPKITEEEVLNLKDKVRKVKTGDIVVLSGSIPDVLGPNFYQALITIIVDKGADFVIDTAGKELLATLDQHPLLIKPNNHELEAMFDVKFNSVQDIVPYGEKLLMMGAKNVMISMAGDGALLFTKDGAYQSNVLKRELKNSVGAGDSMIAGFIGEYSIAQNPIDAFKMGVACGSATAFSDDLAKRNLIDELLKEVEVTKL